MVLITYRFYQVSIDNIRTFESPIVASLLRDGSYQSLAPKRLLQEHYHLHASHENVFGEIISTVIVFSKVYKRYWLHS